VLACDAATLDEVLKPGSVDYIFTDPPYGGFISYLDLSILWNHWLGFPISEQVRELETIVGGECEHTEEHYKEGLARSIKTSLRLLRPDRWFSIVFQHWDISYFATILETASEYGAELKAAITQTGDVIWSMHKKKNSESVLAGEMILTFYKPKQVRKPSNVAGKGWVDDPAKTLSEVFDVCLANGASSFTSEALFNRVIMELWHRRALGCLSLRREEFSKGLEQRGWSYDNKTHRWSKGTDSGSPREELALFGS
jgi:adenine-specific DNA methylase